MINKDKIKDFTNNQKGITALLVVIVLSAGALLLAQSAAVLGFGSLDTGFTFQKGEEASVLADGCLEEALRQIQLDHNYLADNSRLELTGGFCIIDITGDESNKTISIKADSENYIKNIEVTVKISEKEIELETWNKK